MKLSVIIAVLESYIVTKRLLNYFNGFMGSKDCEVIIVDDGSQPSLRYTINLTKLNYDLKIIETNSDIPWNQPAARNQGAKIAKGENLFFTDIDHILTEETIDEAIGFTGDKLYFKRGRAIIDEENKLSTDRKELLLLCPNKREVDLVDSHCNTFVIRKKIFDDLNGYDEKFCGKHGGDDTDFSNRYAEMCYAGKILRGERAKSQVYVYPDPGSATKHLFHSLR